MLRGNNKQEALEGIEKVKHIKIKLAESLYFSLAALLFADGDVERYTT